MPESFGEASMTEETLNESTIKALRKSIVLKLHKNDLIEVLSQVKIMVTSNKQQFLKKCQFTNQLSYNRALELNNLL